MIPYLDISDEPDALDPWLLAQTLRRAMTPALLANPTALLTFVDTIDSHLRHVVAGDQPN